MQSSDDPILLSCSQPRIPSGVVGAGNSLSHQLSHQLPTSVKPHSTPLAPHRVPEGSRARQGVTHAHPLLRRHPGPAGAAYIRSPSTRSAGGEALTRSRTALRGNSSCTWRRWHRSDMQDVAGTKPGKTWLEHPRSSALRRLLIHAQVCTRRRPRGCTAAPALCGGCAAAEVPWRSGLRAGGHLDGVTSAG